MMKKILDWARRHAWALWVFGAVLAVILFFVVSRANAGKQIPYQTARLERGELMATVGASGTVRALQSATLTWQTSGTVEQVNVDVGDRVKRGDVLATLEKTSLPQSIILAQADLVNAQKALDDLLHSDTARAQAWIALREAKDAYKKAYDYRQSLNNKTWVSKVYIRYIGGRPFPIVKWVRDYPDSETIAKADADLALKKAKLDDAQRAYDRLKNGPNPDDLAAAQARVDAAQATLNLARILAPFNGTITQAEPRPGDQVTAGKVAFRMDDLSELLVDVQVSEVDINSISLGQPAVLSFDAILGKEYHGEVVEVSLAGDVVSGAVNFTVTVRLTDADARVKPGMTAAVNIIVDKVEDQLLVPNRAVRLVDGKRVVYVLRNGQPQRVAVTLGPSSDTMSVVLEGDVKEGDLVILNPPMELQGGPRGPFGGGG